jgi:hypothetical protein
VIKSAEQRRIRSCYAIQLVVVNKLHPVGVQKKLSGHIKCYCATSDSPRRILLTINAAYEPSAKNSEYSEYSEH